MKIFVQDIPRKTTALDLSRLVKEAAREWSPFPFIRQPRVVASEIILIRDERGRADYHGLVTVHPASLAKRLAKFLNGRELHGQRVSVWEYRERKPQCFMFDPSCERRRGSLRVERIEHDPVGTIDKLARDCCV